MDTYRFDTDESDLREAVSLFNLYRSNKDNKHALAAVKVDPRAKLISISSFVEKNDEAEEKPTENWSIEAFWSDEEKECLGIKEKDNIMSLDEFNGYISSLIDDIKDYQEAIKCLNMDMQ